MESCGPTITPTYSKLCVGDNGGEAARLNGQFRFADFDSKTRTVRPASMLERTSPDSAVASNVERWA